MVTAGGYYIHKDGKTLKYHNRTVDCKYRGICLDGKIDLFDQELNNKYFHKILKNSMGFCWKNGKMIWCFMALLIKKGWIRKGKCNLEARGY